MADLNINVDLVKAAEDVVSAAAAGVEGAERSCVIEVDNQLPVRLTFDSADHDHGGFGTILPKGVIEPMGFDVFNSRSSGFLTGTEGHIFYRFNDRKLFVHWDNPFAGSNSSDGHVEPDDPRYRVIAITGNGNHGAHMRFIIAETTAVITIAVITKDGNVFGADVGGRTLDPVVQFSGAKIGSNLQDRFALTIGNTIAVITEDGNVFGADVGGRTLGPVFQFSGAKIGFGEEDRFMVAIGNTLVVIRRDGLVFGADVVGREIQPVFQFSGAKIGFNPQDRFMVTIGGR